MSTAVAQPAGGAPTPSPHLQYLDGLRAIAALTVVGAHCLQQVRYEELHLPRWLIHLIVQFNSGHLAVDLFIVLSGFCLALPVVRGDGHLKGGAMLFFRKRARRILPPYFLGLLLSLLLIQFFIGARTGTHWDVSLPVTRESVLAHLFLVQDAFRATTFKINHAYWSISVEWRIYFLFPLILQLRRRLGMLPVLGMATLAAYAVVLLGLHGRLPAALDLDTCGITPQYVSLFVLGILAADVVYGGVPRLAAWRRAGTAYAVLVFTALLAVLALKVKLRHGAPLPVPYADFLVGWFVAAVLVGAGTQISWLRRALSWRPLAFLGTFSYSIYLVHAPLIQLIWQYGLMPLDANPRHRMAALLALGVPLLIGAAYLFFLACEKPFLNKRSALVTPQPQPEVRIQAPVS